MEAGLMKEAFIN